MTGRRLLRGAWVLGLLAPAACLALPIPGAGLGIQVEAREWHTSMDADVEAGTTTIPGTVIDLDVDLNMDDRQRVTDLRAAVYLGGTVFHLGRVELDQQGTQTLTRPITFMGHTFTVSTPVEADLEVAITDVMMERPLPILGLATGGGVAWLGGFRRIQIKGEIRGAGVVKRESLAAWIPQVGVGARIGLVHGVELGARAYGINASAGGAGGATFDWEMGLAWRWRHLRVGGGYRRLWLDLEEDDIEAELVYRGPYLGADLML